jgi:alpha-tubulin suppressor-like RCC1 family protein
VDEQVITSETRSNVLCEIKVSYAVLFHVKCSLDVCYRRPDDWTLSAGGSGTIYGWGHNHRGQLGGIEGAKVKVPTPCEALATLRPVQLIGGEQTLFAVTADGKVRVHLLCHTII